jgi:hypothetical protein
VRDFHVVSGSLATLPTKYSFHIEAMKLIVALNGSDEAVDPGFGELSFSF